MKIKTASAAAVAASSPFTMAYVPLEHIATSKNLPTRPLDAKHVDELLQSIKRVGLDNPLDIWAGEKEGSEMKFKDEVLPMTFLIAGAHRRESLKRLKEEEPSTFKKFFPEGVPVRRRVIPLSEALLLQLRENVQRKDMSSEQVLPVINHLVALGIKQNQIAARVGKSTAWVSMMLDISDTLGEEGAQEVAAGGLPIKAARDAAKALKDAKKSGWEISPKSALEKAKADHAANKGGNEKRAKKRVSLGVLFTRYSQLPGSSVTIGKKVQILEGIINYALNNVQSLPSEVKSEPVVPVKKTAKK